MYKPSQLEVECWKGDWGLPSIDYKCLEVLVNKLTKKCYFWINKWLLLQAFARFTNAPINIKISNNPFRAIKGELPVVGFNKKSITRRQQLIDCLEKQVRELFDIAFKNYIWMFCVLVESRSRFWSIKTTACRRACSYQHIGCSTWTSTTLCLVNIICQ